MWPFGRAKKEESNTNENRPVKLIKVGYNAWQIVYADAPAEGKEN